MRASDGLTAAAVKVSDWRNSEPQEEVRLGSTCNRVFYAEQINVLPLIKSFLRCKGHQELLCACDSLCLKAIKYLNEPLQQGSKSWSRALRLATRMGAKKRPRVAGRSGATGRAMQDKTHEPLVY